MLLKGNIVYKIIFSLLFILSIRAVFIYSFGPNVVSFGDDHPIYHSTAIKLATDPKEWTRPGSEFGYRAPLYFIFLSAIYSIVPEPSYQVGQMLSAILGTLNCLIIFLIVRNYYDEKTAWISFWIRGLLPTFILSDTFVLSELLFDSFMLISFLLLSLNINEPKLYQWLGIGLCMALCVLTREAAILFPFIFLVILAFKSHGNIKTLGRIFVFSMCFIIVLMPWLFRNKLVWGKALPLSYTAGVNLHIGNNIDANGHWVLAPAEGLPNNAKFGTPEFNDWHMLKGKEYIIEDPIRFVKLGFKKIAWFLFPSFHREDIFTVYNFSNKTTNIIAIISGVSSAALILIGIVCFLFIKKDEYWKITLVLMLYSSLVTFIVYGSSRYRDQIDNLLVVFAALLATRWNEITFHVKNLKNKYNRMMIYYCTGIVIFIICNWTWVLRKK